MNNQQMPSGNILGIATEAIQLLRKLVKKTCPSDGAFNMYGANVPVGSTVNSQNLNAAQAKFNSVVGSCLGNGAQINVYVNSSNVGSPPDFVFISGLPSYQYWLPETEINYITVQSVGNNPASFSLKFLNF